MDLQLLRTLTFCLGQALASVFSHCVVYVAIKCIFNTVLQGSHFKAGQPELKSQTETEFSTYS